VGALAERAETLQRLGRMGSACTDIATDDDRHVVRNFIQHGLESREISVDVIKRRDPHPGEGSSTPETIACASVLSLDAHE
jgi:hypothetical protein